MAQYDKVDQRILDTIDLVREEFGSCTAGQVARRMHISKNVVVHRCGVMREAGLVQWNRAAGSLRRVITDLERPREISILRSVHLHADRDDEVGAWCRKVIEVSELLPGAALTHPRDLGGGAPPAPSVGGTVAEPAGASTSEAGTEVDLHCCGRDFKNLTGLLSHQRTRAHLETQAGSCETAAGPDVVSPPAPV